MEYPRNDRFCPVCRSLRKEAIPSAPLTPPVPQGSANTVADPTSLAMVFSPKQAFDNLYQAMTGKTLKEKDEVIYATCRLCSLHQQTGFIDGIRLGLRMAQELNN